MPVRQLDRMRDGYEIRPNQYVYIEPAVFESLAQYRYGETEAGGLIFGSYRGPHIHVTDVTLPQKADIRSRYFFNRKDRNHIKKANSIHRNSKGLITTIGEWHSHPETLPSPSRLDQSEWLRVANHRHPLRSLFLIIGYSGEWLGIS